MTPGEGRVEDGVHVKFLSDWVSARQSVYFTKPNMPSYSL
jgi:hypothetical protein